MSANPSTQGTQIPPAEGQPPRRIPSDILQAARAEAATLVASDPELKKYPALALRATTADRQMHLE